MRFVCGLFVILVSMAAQAGQLELITNFVNRIASGGLSGCPPLIIMEEGETFPGTDSHCQSAQFAYTKHQANPSDEEAALTVLKELLAARDFRHVVVHGLHLVTSAEPLSSSAEFVTEAKFLVMKAATSAALKLGPERDSRWLWWLAEIEVEEDSTGLAEHLSIQTFINENSTSPHIQEVSKWRDQIAAQLLEREMGIVKSMKDNDRYFAAIVRLEKLYDCKAIENSPSLKPLLLEMIDIFQALLKDLNTSGKSLKKIYPAQLRRIFELPIESPANAQVIRPIIEDRIKRISEFAAQL